jgi:hypothetical protein
MSKAKRKKTPTLILQHDQQTAVEIVGRNVMRGQGPTRYTDADQRKWAVVALSKDVKLRLKERIILSAAKTLISDKAWLNAISCRNVFAESPAIEFLNDRTDHFGGKLEFWLENLSGPKNLQFVIRMTGYSQGGATITVGSSFPTAFSLVPVTITGSMNLTLGNILQVPTSTPGGLGLLTLEVKFHNAQYGSWQFIDVSITEAT